MSVQRYWAERLTDKRPIRSVELWQLKSAIRADDEMENWPRAVSKEIMYMDYKQWYEEIVLPQYACSEYYRNNPNLVPQPVEYHTFFTIIGPWLYVTGDKKNHVRHYRVQMNVPYKNSWATVRRLKSFIRLSDWEDHVAAFELHTGTALRYALGWTLGTEGEVKRAQKIEQAKIRIRQMAEENKANLPEAMRGSSESVTTG